MTTSHDPVPVLSLREQGKEKRRARIIAAARDLIIETGAASLTMRALAEKADVSLATPYNLFGSRIAILATILEDDVVQFVRSLDGLVSSDPLQRIFDTVDLAHAFYAAEPRFYHAIFAEVFLSQSEVRASFAQQRRVIWEKLVADAMGGAFIDARMEAHVVCDVLTMYFVAAISDWVRGSLPFPLLATQIKTGFAMILKGVATRKSAPVLAQHLERYQALLVAGQRERAGEPGAGDHAVA